MQKTIEINGRTFELSTRELDFYDVTSNFRYGGRTIYDCYKRPSKAKETIYRYWESWFNELRDNEVEWEYEYRFGVMSYNCNFFSIHAYFKYLGTWFYVEITAFHSRAWKLS